MAQPKAWKFDPNLGGTIGQLNSRNQIVISKDNRLADPNGGGLLLFDPSSGNIINELGPQYTGATHIYNPDHWMNQRARQNYKDAKYPNGLPLTDNPPHPAVPHKFAKVPQGQNTTDPMARERNPKLIQWGQEGEFSSQNPNLIYMNDPRGVVTDAPTRMFDTHTGAITSSGGRGPGSTLNIGDKGYQAAIDRYNKFNPQGTALQSLAGLSGQTSGIASQLGEYGTQMSDMQSQFGTRGETLADMQSQFGTRGETISGMQKQLGGFGDQFSKINEGIGGLTTQYGDMQKLLDNFQGQTALFSGGIHDQLGQMEGRIGQLEQQGQAGGFGGGFGSNNFNPVYSGGSYYSQSPGYGGNYMPLNFGSGLNMPNSGGYPSSAYYGGISPFMFGFY